MKVVLFVLGHKRLKTYPHADAKQKKTLLWPYSKLIHFRIRRVFGKYVDKFNTMRIKYTRQMKFCKNEYQLLNIKCDQYENLTLINDFK